jgi:hypothetical protein
VGYFLLRHHRSPPVASVAERPFAEHESTDIRCHLRARAEEALAEIFMPADDARSPCNEAKLAKGARSLSCYVRNRTRVSTFERLRAGSCILACPRRREPYWSASGLVAGLHSTEVTT